MSNINERLTNLREEALKNVDEYTKAICENDFRTMNDLDLKLKDLEKEYIREKSNTLNQEEFIKPFDENYRRVLLEAQSHSYAINQPQFEKFVYIIEFFKKYIKDNNCGKIVDLELDSNFIQNGITIEFDLFEANGDTLKDFSKVMEYSSAVTIDATLNGQISISIGIANVFIKDD